MNWEDVQKNPALADLIERTLETDGWQLIEELIDDERRSLYRRLAKSDTSWELTNRIRGELAAIDRWSKTMIRDHLSDTPRRPG